MLVPQTRRSPPGCHKFLAGYPDLPGFIFGRLRVWHPSKHTCDGYILLSASGVWAKGLTNQSDTVYRCRRGRVRFRDDLVLFPVTCFLLRLFTGPYTAGWSVLRYLSTLFICTIYCTTVDLFT